MEKKMNKKIIHIKGVPKVAVKILDIAFTLFSIRC